MQKLLMGLIRLYQLLISPVLGPSCRYYPTCSQYAVEAIQKHGPFYGSLLAIKRIFKCHPGYEGGLDPVPEKSEHKKKCHHGSSKNSI